MHSFTSFPMQVILTIYFSSLTENAAERNATACKVEQSTAEHNHSLFLVQCFSTLSMLESPGQLLKKKNIVFKASF